MSRSVAPVSRPLAPLSRLLAPVPADRRARRFAQLLAGLVGYGVTASMMVLAGLGLDPWDVFHQGLSRTFGLAIGTWAVIATVLVLVCGWIPLRQRPGIGTVLNALMVGLVMDVMLAAVHPPHVLWARIALLVGGVIGNGFATGFYIGAGLGPGPRDGLSTGIAEPRTLDARGADHDRGDGARHRLFARRERGRGDRALRGGHRPDHPFDDPGPGHRPARRGCQRRRVSDTKILWV